MNVLNITKKNSPILCRDKTTFTLLKNNGVDVSLYGCLTQLLDIKNIPDNKMGLDIGFQSICYFNKTINKLPKDEVIIWNGPMGVFEKQQFSYGTEAISKTLMYKKDNMIIIGGGDSVSALKKFVSNEEIQDFKSNGNHISTGGGASLEFLEGKMLPGIITLSGQI